MKREKPSKMRSDWRRRTSWSSPSLSTWISQSRSFDAALQRVQAELQKTPQSAMPHFLQGKIYAAQGRWDRAEAALLKALELDPNYLNAYDLLISTYVASNKLPQAIRQVESSVQEPGQCSRVDAFGV